MNNYKALFEMYGETQELVDEYVRDLIRGSANFHEYNSPIVFRRYLESRYGVSAGIDVSIINLSPSRVDEIDWMYNICLPEIKLLSLNENELKSIIGIGTKIRSAFPNIQYLSLYSNTLIPDAEWELELPNLRYIQELRVPYEVYKKMRAKYSNLLYSHIEFFSFSYHE